MTPNGVIAKNPPFRGGKPQDLSAGETDLTNITQKEVNMELYNIGETIRAVQKEKAISNADFARYAGTSPQQVIRWRKNKNVKIHTLQLIASVLGVPVSRFI